MTHTLNLLTRIALIATLIVEPQNWLGLSEQIRFLPNH